MQENENNTKGITESFIQSVFITCILVILMTFSYVSLCNDKENKETIQLLRTEIGALRTEIQELKANDDVVPTQNLSEVHEYICNDEGTIIQETIWIYDNDNQFPPIQTL